MINPDLARHDFYKLDKSQQAGFKKFRVVTVPKGTLLFKMTSGKAEAWEGRVTPWWSAVKPFLDDREGALGRFLQAKANGVNMTAMVRLMSCVCLDWNDLDNYVQVELTDDARAFWGTFNPMPKFSQPVWKPDWKNKNDEGSPKKALEQVKRMQLKEATAGFNVPDMLGAGEAWQLFIPNLTENDIKRASVIPGHDMTALAMSLNG